MHHLMVYGLLVCAMLVQGQPTHKDWPWSEDHTDDDDDWPTNEALYSIMGTDQGEVRETKREMIAKIKTLKTTIKKLKNSSKKLKSMNKKRRTFIAESLKLVKMNLRKSEELKKLNNVNLALKQAIHTIKEAQKAKGSGQPAVPSCSQPSGSEKFINGGHKSNINYSEIIPRIQQRNSKSDLYVFDNNFAFRMSIIEGQLWVPVYSNHTIQILDPNMSSKIKEISLTNIHTDMYPISVHQTHSNEVLLAAYHGLYVLDIHGSYLYKVGDGDIYDIVIASNKAYAYNTSDNSVVTVGFSAGQWGVTNTFTASSSSRSDANTITLLDNKIYLCSRASHTIQSYTITGSFVNTYSVSGSYSPGQLWDPWLCGTDSQGSLLVCDRYNHRLQVLSPGGTWREYELEGVRSPYDVVVDTRCNLWVLWYNNNTPKDKISKFTV